MEAGLEASRRRERSLLEQNDAHHFHDEQKFKFLVVERVHAEKFAFANS